MSTSPEVSRRGFLKTGLAAGALTGAGLGGFYFGYNSAVGSPVRVGVIGTGDEGSVLIGALNPKYVEVKAIADIRPYNRFRAFHGDWGVPVRPGLMSVYGWKSEKEAKKRVKVYGPYQELLANAKADGIEAIILATPLHLHAPIAIAAMNQGLHVITEKLMAHDVLQCKKMARVAKDKNLYLAIGHQRHYNIKYWQAQDWIKRGVIGNLHSIRAQWHRNNLPPPSNDSWKMPLPPGVKPADMPGYKIESGMKVKIDDEIVKARRVLAMSYGKEAEGALDKLAQLEAQKADAVLNEKSAKGKREVETLGYQGKDIRDASGKVVYECTPLEELIRWRLWDRTSAGMMAELGSHQLDAASIFVSALYPEGAEHPHPLRVTAAANRPIFGPDRDIEDHVCCIIEFPMPEYKEEDPKTHRKKIEVQYASVNGNGYLNYGELVYGTKGTIALKQETELKLLTGSEDGDEGETSVKVSGGGGPTLDTQSSGPAHKAAASAEAPVSKGYAEELEHWAWCIRNGDPRDPKVQPRCPPKVAMADAIIALTTNLAVRTGEPISFKKEWFDSTKDDTPEKDLKFTKGGVERSADPPRFFEEPSMYLHANEKVIGVKNFHSAVGSPLVRRAMIQKALKQGLLPGKGLEAAIFGYKPPKKPLVAGLLGAGQQGLRLLKAASPKYINVKSVAELRPSNRKLVFEAAGIPDAGTVYLGGIKRQYKSSASYDSYEKLLAAAKDDGLEAVIVALPSHLHGPAALAALDAGLHVFIEPPMALTVADAKKIVAKAEEKKLSVAVGQQRHYNWVYDYALEMVRKDLLDQPHYLRSQWHLAKPEKAAGNQIDWWADVPANEREMDFAGYGSPDELVRWRLYEKYSGGLLAELGSQLIDAAVMLVAASPNHDPKRPFPLSVAGSASQVLPNAQGDIDDHVHCIFEYAIQGYVDAAEIPPKARKKIALQFDMIIGSDFDGYGETVLGRKGSLVLESERKPMLFFMADVDKSLRLAEKKDAPGVPQIEVPKDGKTDEESAALGQLALAGADAGFAAESAHWAACCKQSADSSAKPRCDARAGLYTTVLTVAATKAVQKGTRVAFKDEWFDVKSEKTPDGIQ